MEKAGYEAKPSVLEREFNTRHWGKPMTLHGVRRWLLGETMPGPRKLTTLAQWLQVRIEDFVDPGSAAQRGTSEPIHKWHAGMGYDDRELFDIYLKLPVPQRRLAREVILAIARAHEAGEAKRSKED